MIFKKIPNAKFFTVNTYTKSVLLKSPNIPMLKFVLQMISCISTTWAFFSSNIFLFQQTYVMFYSIRQHLYNFKNVKNSYGGVLLLAKSL